MATMEMVKRPMPKPGRPKRITDNVKNAIVHFYNEGMDVPEIARTLNISKPSVYRVLQERRPREHEQ